MVPSSLEAGCPWVADAVEASGVVVVVVPVSGASADASLVGASVLVAEGMEVDGVSQLVDVVVPGTLTASAVLTAYVDGRVPVDAVVPGTVAQASLLLSGADVG